MNDSTQNWLPKGPFPVTKLLLQVETEAEREALIQEIVESIYSLDLKSAEKSVLVAWFCSQLEGNEAPTAARLGWMTRISKRTVHKWLTSLRQKKILVPIANRDRGISYALDIDRALRTLGRPPYTEEP